MKRLITYKEEDLKSNLTKANSAVRRLKEHAALGFKDCSKTTAKEELNRIETVLNSFGVLKRPSDNEN